MIYYHSRRGVQWTTMTIKKRQDTATLNVQIKFWPLQESISTFANSQGNEHLTAIPVWGTMNVHDKAIDNVKSEKPVSIVTRNMDAQVNLAKQCWESIKV